MTNDNAADAVSRRSLAFKQEDQTLIVKLRSELERLTGKPITLSFVMREALKALAEKLNVSAT